MKIRKYTIHNESGKIIEFEVDLNNNNQITTVKDEMKLTFSCRRKMYDMVHEANIFMDNNTVNKVEVEEITT